MKTNRTADVVRIYDDVSTELHGLLYQKLGNRQEAEEIAQEAFERLCSVVEREDINDVRRYFFTMAKRLALNALRRREVEKAYVIRERSVQSLHLAVEPNPEQLAVAEEMLSQARATLSSLPSKTRHVFLLHRFEAYTYQEIADQLGMSKKSVEYHMNRALSAIVAAVGDGGS